MLVSNTVNIKTYLYLYNLFLNVSHSFRVKLNISPWRIAICTNNCDIKKMQIFRKKTFSLLRNKNLTTTVQAIL